MAKIHVSLGYHRSSPDTFDTFAVGVRDGIFGNPTQFATPPVTSTAFQALIDDYINKRAAYKQGGLAQKGPYQAARTALMAAVDTLSEYVDDLADGNENIILLSGFVPTKATDTEPAVPAAPHVVTLTRGPSRELMAECNKVPGADFYGCILIQGIPMPPFITMNGMGQITAVAIQEDNPNPDEYKPINGSIVVAIDLNKNRQKHFVGLVKGVDYYVYFYAGNATGISAFSEVESIMCG
jgi:hypothetical protein